jgi:hypothetical protein
MRNACTDFLAREKVAFGRKGRSTRKEHTSMYSNCLRDFPVPTSLFFHSCYLMYTSDCVSLSLYIRSNKKTQIISFQFIHGFSLTNAASRSMPKHSQYVTSCFRVQLHAPSHANVPVDPLLSIAYYAIPCERPLSVI